MLQHCIPVREIISTKVNELPIEFAGTIFSAIVDEDITSAEVFCLRENDFFMKKAIFVAAKMSLDPMDFVCQC